ncbi:MAG: serine/threonine protein kinase, partial [Candidatus Obscuribacterales bacterium]|nr:serine/threonine protein kinase [Candidatus Obscuribacterales bacterium]
MKINPGAVLNGRYEILAELGEGGFATVYKSKDLQLNRELAIKVVKAAGLGDSMARFQREAKLLGGLSHKNIVSVYSFDLLEDQTPFIAMEYLQGKSLLQLIGQQGALEFSQLKSIMVQVCAGLSYAHKAGAIHRDLSPANIFLIGDDADPLVKILDFGLSRIFGENTGAALTTTGMLVGNPPYMSPEQARGAALDHSSDIYSIGCVFYECFSGKSAFAS